MSTQPHRRYTLEEYFVLELASEEKYEYFDGEVFSVSGASPEHEQIIANCLVALRAALRGRSCRIYPWLVSLNCEVSLRDLYEGVELPPVPPPPIERAEQ